MEWEVAPDVDDSWRRLVSLQKPGNAGFKIIIFIFTFNYVLSVRSDFVAENNFCLFSIVTRPVVDSRSGTDELCLFDVRSLFQRKPSSS